MNHLSNEDATGQPNFADQLRRLRDTQSVNEIHVPELSQWMQFWNDEESETVNLRNINHWLMHTGTRN
jgi:hypothetical protein